jgi:hypothetical protein
MYTGGMYYAVRENFFRAGASAEEDDSVVVTSPGPTIQGCEASTIRNHCNAHQHAFAVQQY